MPAAFQKTRQGRSAGRKLFWIRRQSYVSAVPPRGAISSGRRGEVASVDQALYDFGMAMGPLATADLAGLDIGWRIRKEHPDLYKAGMRRPIAEDRLCELGRFGQKTGAGWYKYDENRRATPDAEVAAIGAPMGGRGRYRSARSVAEEIVERCIYAMVNEGARVLEEGIMLRAVDLDIIYLNGYGFPAYRGGPMWYADTVGLKKVYERVCEFRRQHGEQWEPAAWLERLAEQAARRSPNTIRQQEAGGSIYLVLRNEPVWLRRFYRKRTFRYPSAIFQIRSRRDQSGGIEPRP